MEWGASKPTRVQGGEDVVAHPHGPKKEVAACGAEYRFRCETRTLVIRPRSPNQCLQEEKKRYTEVPSDSLQVEQRRLQQRWKERASTSNPLTGAKKKRVEQTKPSPEKTQEAKT